MQPSSVMAAARDETDASGPGVHVVMVPAWRTTNPYTSWLALELTERGCQVRDLSLRRPPDRGILHFHWPENATSAVPVVRAILDSSRTAAACLVAKVRGVRIVWTVHNLEPHERPHPVLFAGFMWLFLRLLDGWIYPRPSLQAEASARWPRLARLPSAGIPLGEYSRLATSGEGRQRSDASAISAIGDGHTPVVLMFGTLRRYKGLDAALDIAAELDGEARLVIVGQVDERSDLAAVDRARATDNVELLSGYVDDADIPGLLARSSVLILPFSRVTNSSTALLGLSFGVPLVGTTCSALQDLATAVGPQWVRMGDGAVAMADHVRDLLGKRPGGAPDLTEFSWSRIGADTLKFYQHLLGQHPPIRHR